MTHAEYINIIVRVCQLRRLRLAALAADRQRRAPLNESRPQSRKLVESRKGLQSIIVRVLPVALIDEKGNSALQAATNPIGGGAAFSLALACFRQARAQSDQRVKVS